MAQESISLDDLLINGLLSNDEAVKRVSLMMKKHPAHSYRKAIQKAAVLGLVDLEATEAELGVGSVFEWTEGKDEKCETCDTENKKRYSWKVDIKTCRGTKAAGADAVRTKEEDRQC